MTARTSSGHPRFNPVGNRYWDESPGETPRAQRWTGIGLLFGSVKRTGRDGAQGVLYAQLEPRTPQSGLMDWQLARFRMGRAGTTHSLTQGRGSDASPRPDNDLGWHRRFDSFPGESRDESAPDQHQCIFDVPSLLDQSGAAFAPLPPPPSPPPLLTSMTHLCQEEDFYIGREGQYTRINPGQELQESSAHS